MIDVHQTTVKDLHALAAKRGVRGVVGAADEGKARLISWRDGARYNKARGRYWNPEVSRPSPAGHLVAKLNEGLPAVVRRTPRQRYDVLLQRLVQDGLKSYKAFGRVEWPKSIQDELRVLGWKDGDPNFWGQAEALARKFIEEGANIQRAKDQRKVTLDWHGHLSA